MLNYTFSNVVVKNVKFKKGGNLIRNIFALLVLSVFLVGCLAVGTFAAEDSNNHEFTNQPTEGQVTTMVEPGFEYEDIDILMKEVSEAITQQTGELENTKAITPKTYALFINENKTCTGADFGGCDSEAIDGSPALDHASGTNLGGFADAGVNCSYAFEKTHGKSVAWIGNRISVCEDYDTNDTQGSCTINFSGDAEGGMSLTGSYPVVGNWVCAWAEVYDLTDKKLIDQFHAWNVKNYSNTNFPVTFDPSGTVTLKAGHVYDFRMVIYTEAFDNLGFNTSSVDFYSNRRGNDGLDYDQISFQWN